MIQCIHVINDICYCACDWCKENDPTVEEIEAQMKKEHGK